MATESQAMKRNTSNISLSAFSMQFQSSHMIKKVSAIIKLVIHLSNVRIIHYGTF